MITGNAIAVKIRRSPKTKTITNAFRNISKLCEPTSGGQKFCPLLVEKWSDYRKDLTLTDGIEKYALKSHTVKDL
jgi:hypothetical protein